MSACSFLPLYFLIMSGSAVAVTRGYGASIEGSAIVGNTVHLFSQGDFGLAITRAKAIAPSGEPARLVLHPGTYTTETGELRLSNGDNIEIYGYGQEETGSVLDVKLLFGLTDTISIRLENLRLRKEISTVLSSFTFVAKNVTFEKHLDLINCTATITDVKLFSRFSIEQSTLTLQGSIAFEENNTIDGLILDGSVGDGVTVDGSEATIYFSRDNSGRFGLVRLSGSCDVTLGKIILNGISGSEVVNVNDDATGSVYIEELVAYLNHDLSAKDMVATDGVANLASNGLTLRIGQASTHALGDGQLWGSFIESTTPAVGTGSNELGETLYNDK